jgi:hypothetical protein
MRKLRSIIPVGCILLLMGISMFAVPTAQAAEKVVFGPPTEGTRVTFNENSIDGPALSGFLMDFPTGFPAGYPRGFPKSALAWTGTDSLHRLNYLISNDGLHYTNKHTLNETSLWRPAVALMNGAGFNVNGLVSRGEVLALAWTGDDAAHTLNLEYIDTYDFHLIKKITLWGETSFTAPAISFWASPTQPEFGVRIAWGGTDPNNTLNTLRFNQNGQISSKQTFWGWRTHSRPDLQYFSNNGMDRNAILAWTGPDLRLHDAQSTDMVHWTLLSDQHPIVEWSNSAPSMIHTAINIPSYWLAWTGLDAAHSLNVMYTENFPTWQDVQSKTTFHETPLGGPELAYVGVTKQVIVAWADNAAPHTLHVAVIFTAS